MASWPSNSVQCTPQRSGREARLNADYWRGGVFVYETATGSRALIEEEVTQGWAGRIRASAQRGQAALLLRAFKTLVVEVVDTPEHAVEAANRTMYGLASSILSGDTYGAFELAPKILAGIVNANSPTVNDEIHAPMGGVRDSGWGRTGPDSLKEFQDVIWINSHSGQRQYPI
jgi:hypothetical protein